MKNIPDISEGCNDINFSEESVKKKKKTKNNNSDEEEWVILTKYKFGYNFLKIK